MEYNSEEILRLMKERRSVRSFTDKPIEDEKLNMILEAGRWCQSANNAQPWRFIVIKNKQTIKNLANKAPYGRFISQAPVVLAIVALNTNSNKWFLHDTCILSQQICLIAWSLGIGTCWIGSMDREKAGKILNLKQNEFLTTILPLGYPKSIPNPPSRKSVDQLVSFEN